MEKAITLKQVLGVAKPSLYTVQARDTLSPFMGEIFDLFHRDSSAFSFFVVFGLFFFFFSPSPPPIFSLLKKANQSKHLLAADGKGKEGGTEKITYSGLLELLSY